MSKFDSEEKRIYDLFSKITVDSSKLKEQVIDKLHEEGPKVVTKKRGIGQSQ